VSPNYDATVAQRLKVVKVPKGNFCFNAHVEYGYSYSMITDNIMFDPASSRNLSG
jgi:hypothetical protein